MKEVKALVGLDPNDRFDEAVWKHYKDTVDDQVAFDDLLKTDRIVDEDSDKGSVQIYTDPEGNLFATLIYTMGVMSRKWGEQDYTVWEPLLHLSFVDGCGTMPCTPGTYVHMLPADDGKPAYDTEEDDDEEV